ncbi:helix-turn-helix domain-containing protein [Falsiroseomonas sp. CW058]|uniref:helix-turn-helix domain-containing protein n=1 Tax=Falsiroseomonas sp. CW058 TaxID=3388664 RepID=UPI003D311C00
MAHGISTTEVPVPQFPKNQAAGDDPHRTDHATAQPPVDGMSLMDIPEVCAKTLQGRTTIFKKIKERELPAVKLGRRTMIRRSDFEAWIATLPPVKGAR